MIKQPFRDQEKGLIASKYAAEDPQKRDKRDRELADRIPTCADADKEFGRDARSPEQQPDDDER